MTTLGALATIALAAPASAAPPTVTTTVRHVQFADHYDDNPSCGTVASTVYYDGTDRLHVAFAGDTIHASYGATFKIREVPDDPSFPTLEREATDSFTFQLTNGGVQVFHESFHDSVTPFGDLRLYTTFVAVDGVVKVDYTRVGPSGVPPPGC